MSQPPADLVQRVVEVTESACSIAEAKHLLAACNNDLEAAIALFFEGGAGGGVNVDDDALPANVNGPDEMSTAHAPIIDDDGIRAPIAPIREQLIGPNDDNFYSNAASSAASTSTTTAAGGRLSQQTRRVKVCPLRDFAREGALMEEELQQATTSGFNVVESVYEKSPNSRSRFSRYPREPTVTNLDANIEPKRKRLEDLYRPPTDIAFAGTFQAARSKAEAWKRWLLVNVQSDNFDSQLLNRDVWPDKTLRKLLKRQFLLWQVDVDSSEGRRFVAFYHCAKLPYLCVIDPRTGEEMWKKINPKHSNVLPELNKFLLVHKDFNLEMIASTSSSASSSAKQTDNAINLESDGKGNQNDNNNKNIGNHADEDASISSSNYNKDCNKILELSEEEQIALAIRNSIRENGTNGVTYKSSSSIQGDDGTDHDDLWTPVDGGGGSDIDSNVEEFVEDDIKSVCESTENTSYEQQLGSATKELTMLKLRLLNMNGADEVVQLRWPSDTLVKVLHTYINQAQPHITKKGYKLICAFPRKTLEAEHDLRTLKEIGLHPSANIHITLNDD